VAIVGGGIPIASPRAVSGRRARVERHRRDTAATRSEHPGARRVGRAPAMGDEHAPIAARGGEEGGAMEAADAADTIREAAEGAGGAARDDAERFRRGAAVTIAVLAMLLAITSLGGANAGKETTNNNIQASDSYAFYQAKAIRQTAYQLAADDLQTRLDTTEVPTAERAALQRRLEAYTATIARYESEPGREGQPGQGKRELLAQAQGFEARRDRAQRQDPNFDYAQALFQIAIVLGSVSIVATSRRLLLLALALGAVATVLMLNGYLLLFALPLG
jgi:hypothetical protein